MSRRRKRKKAKEESDSNQLDSTTTPEDSQAQPPPPVADEPTLDPTLDSSLSSQPAHQKNPNSPVNDELDIELGDDFDIEEVVKPSSNKTILPSASDKTEMRSSRKSKDTYSPATPAKDSSSTKENATPHRMPNYARTSLSGIDLDEELLDEELSDTVDELSLIHI